VLYDSAILGSPLLKAASLIQNVIIDSAASGRPDAKVTHASECNESISAYIGRHRHTPEIEQILDRASGIRWKSSSRPRRPWTAALGTYINHHQ
jgi:N-acetyl-gamma-glutamylphosphate reductase